MFRETWHECVFFGSTTINGEAQVPAVCRRTEQASPGISVHTGMKYTHTHIHTLTKTHLSQKGFTAAVIFPSITSSDLSSHSHSSWLCHLLLTCFFLMASPAFTASVSSTVSVIMTFKSVSVKENKYLYGCPHAVSCFHTLSLTLFCEVIIFYAVSEIQQSELLVLLSLVERTVFICIFSCSACL